MTTIAANLQAVHRRIFEALQGDSRTVTLVAVSKSQSTEKIREAHRAGCRNFGENYVQEATAKMAELGDLDVAWHFIGHLQTNKARAVAERFDWVHGIDRIRQAVALSRERTGKPALNVCIQVNISGEGTKGGVAPAMALGLAREIMDMPNLRLRGLMGMASFSDDARQQRARFGMLRRTHDEIRAAGIGLDTLSMGMTQDLEAAIAEGATMVRIGTAIFGERQKRAAA